MLGRGRFLIEYRVVREGLIEMVKSVHKPARDEAAKWRLGGQQHQGVACVRQSGGGGGE